MELNINYIRSQVEAKGILPVYELAILDYLNNAQNAVEIAGMEPKGGPIWDDPNSGYSGDRRGYDIGEKVAQRILDRRKELGGFSSLDDLVGIPYFGPDKFNDLLYTFVSYVVPVPTGLGQEFDRFIAALGALELDASRRRMARSDAFSAIRKLIFDDTAPGKLPTSFSWDDVFQKASRVEIPSHWATDQRFQSAARVVRNESEVKIDGRLVSLAYVISGLEARALESDKVAKRLNGTPDEVALEVATFHGFLANTVFQSLRQDIGNFQPGYQSEAEVVAANYVMYAGRERMIATADAYSMDYNPGMSLTWNLLNYYTDKEGAVANRFSSFAEKLQLGDLVEGRFVKDDLEYRTPVTERMAATGYRFAFYNGFEGEAQMMASGGLDNPGGFAFMATTGYVLDKFIDNLALEVGMEKNKPSILSWNRLEPRPRTNNFKRALRAEVRDALWFLSRQWQMGEFAAEDTGSAVEMRVDMETARLKRYSLGFHTPRNFDPSIPMEALVEREPVHLDLSLRVEMGQHWLKLLEATLTANPGALPGPDVAAILNDFKGDHSLYFSIPMPGEDFPEVHSSPELKNWYAAVSNGRCLDGGALYSVLKSGTPAMSYVTSIATPEATARVGQAATQFMAWFSRVYSQPGSASDSAWAPSHLEYQFHCSVPNGNFNTTVLAADEYASGSLDWYSFDIEQNTPSQIASIKNGSNAGLINRRVSTILPGDLQFPGMPMARWWQFEDGKVDIGALRADTSEPGKLILAEFALIYSNDWMLLPFRIPVGTTSTVRSLVVKDVFGQYTSVMPAGAGDNSDWQRWSLFNLHRRNNNEVQADTRLFIPPAVVKMMESEPVESVTFLRDEMANMVWAVEGTIPDGLGGGKEGYEAARRLKEYLVKITPEAAPPPLASNNAKIEYELGTTVPENWIPFIPVRLGGVMSREIQLRRAAMPRIIEGRDPERIRPRTELLRTGYDAGTGAWNPYFVFEEEVPRSGAIVDRTWQRTRWMDGSVVTWMGRRKRNGRGEANSGLEFDNIKDRD